MDKELNTFLEALKAGDEARGWLRCYDREVSSPARVHSMFNRGVFLLAEWAVARHPQLTNHFAMTAIYALADAAELKDTALMSEVQDLFWRAADRPKKKHIEVGDYLYTDASGGCCNRFVVVAAPFNVPCVIVRDAGVAWLCHDGSFSDWDHELDDGEDILIWLKAGSEMMLYSRQNVEGHAGKCGPQCPAAVMGWQS